MPIEISRETYVDARDERDRNGMTYDMLHSICNKLDEMQMGGKKQIDLCNIRFIKVENHERRNSLIAAGIGGMLVVCFDWAKSLIGKLL